MDDVRAFVLDERGKDIESLFVYLRSVALVFYSVPRIPRLICTYQWHESFDHHFDHKQVRSYLRTFLEGLSLM